MFECFDKVYKQENFCNVVFEENDELLYNFFTSTNFRCDTNLFNLWTDSDNFHDTCDQCITNYVASNYESDDDYGLFINRLSEHHEICREYECAQRALKNIEELRVAEESLITCNQCMIEFHKLGCCDYYLETQNEYDSKIYDLLIQSKSSICFSCLGITDFNTFCLSLTTTTTTEPTTEPETTITSTFLYIDIYPTD